MFFLSDSTKRIYPWVICLTGIVSLVVINGLTTTSLSVFDEELIKEFGLNRSEIKTKEGVTNLVAAIFIIFSGIFIDRFRVKRLMLFGSAVMVGAFLFYSIVANKYQLYFAHFLLGIALISAGSIPVIILVSTWFKERRGLALGLTLIGTSFGGFIFPPILSDCIKTDGWRETFTYLSFLPAILFLIVWAIVKNAPEDIGTKAYGEKEVAAHEPATHGLLQTGMDYQTAIRTPTFWLICMCGMLTFYSVVGIVANLFLHLRGLGFDTKQASFALSLYFLLSLTGKFLISTLSDFLNVNLVFTLCSATMTLGIVGFALMDKNLIYWSVGLTALSWGGIFTLYNVMIVKTFGLKSAGKINGTISFWESVGSFLAPVLTGYLYDQSQSYAHAFWLIAGIMVISTLISLKFRSYTYIVS